MQKTVIIFLIIFIFSCQSNENSELNYQDFYENHKNDESLISFKMMPFLFKLFIDKHDEETNKALDQIKSVSVLINEKSDSHYVESLNKHLPDSRYKQLMKMNDEQTNIEFLTYEKGDLAEEIIMIVKEGNTCVVMFIKGSFDKENVKNLSKNININDVVKYRI